MFLAVEGPKGSLERIGRGLALRFGAAAIFFGADTTGLSWVGLRGPNGIGRTL